MTYIPDASVWSEWAWPLIWFWLISVALAWLFFGPNGEPAPAVPEETK